MSLRYVRLGDAVDKQSLLSRFAIGALGYADQCHVPKPQRLELLMDLADLPQSTIDEQHVRRRDLPVLDPLVTAFERLTQRSIVIPWCHAGDVESAVFLLERTLGAEDDAGGNGPLAARVTDVEALNPRWHLRQIELGGERGKHLIHPALLSL